MEFFPDLSPERVGVVLFNALSFLSPTARRGAKEEMVCVDGAHARFAAERKEKEGEMDGSLSPWALVRERTPRAFLRVSIFTASFVVLRILTLFPLSSVFTK